MKKIMICLILILLVLYSAMLLANDNSNLLPENKDLYAVVTGARRYQNGSDVRIIKLNLNNEDNEDFRLVDNFQTDMNMDVDNYPGHNFLTVKDGYGNMFILKFIEPWNVIEYHIIGMEPSFSYSEDGNTYLCQIFFDDLVFLNLNTWEEKSYEIIKGSYAARVLYEEGQFLGFNIKDGKFKMIPNGKPYPYEPPRDIIGEAETAVVTFNKDKYRMIHFNEYNSEEENIGKDALFNKIENSWVLFDIRGEHVLTSIFDPFLIYRIGNVEPGHSTVFNGKFEIINYRREEKHEIYLEPPSNIYIANEHYAIAKSKDKILYLPVIDGKISVEDAIILYEETEFTRGLVEDIDGLFFGPAEIPEGIMKEKAIKTNKFGEDLYNLDNKRYKYKAMNLFYLAIECAPDYVPPYKNIGIVYYDWGRYSRSIEYFEKAIDLAKDDINKAESYYNLAKAYEAKYEWETALENYQKAFELNDDEVYKKDIERMEEKIQ